MALKPQGERVLERDLSAAFRNAQNREDNNEVALAGANEVSLVLEKVN